MQTFRAEVTGLNENVWSTNSLEFETKQEAIDWVKDLSGRWFGCDMGRVVTTDTPRNQQVNIETDELVFNYRR
jgi:hypothetical protein